MCNYSRFTNRWSTTMTNDIPPPPPPQGMPPQNDVQQRAQQAADAAKVAAQDALGAFQKMMIDPIGSLGAAFRQLGDSKALGVGAVFGVAGAIAIALAVNLIMSSYFGSMSFVDTIKSILAQLVGVAGCAVGFMLLAPLFQVQKNLSASVFVSGAAYLVMGIGMLAAAICVKVSFNLGAGLSILVASCFGILMINAGWRQIYGATERWASFGVPGCLAISAALSYIVAKVLN
jgi:hypothetical protein